MPVQRYSKDVISQRGNELFEHSIAAQVAGHPAIRTKNNVAATSCFFRVAAAQGQTFTLRFTSLRQGLEESCGPARALAEIVMSNLPPLKS